MRAGAARQRHALQVPSMALAAVMGVAEEETHTQSPRTQAEACINFLEVFFNIYIYIYSYSLLIITFSYTVKGTKTIIIKKYLQLLLAVHRSAPSWGCGWRWSRSPSSTGTGWWRTASGRSGRAARPTPTCSATPGAARRGVHAVSALRWPALGRWQAAAQRLAAHAYGSGCWASHLGAPA